MVGAKKCTFKDPWNTRRCHCLGVKVGCLACEEWADNHGGVAVLCTGSASSQEKYYETDTPLCSLCLNTGSSLGITDKRGLRECCPGLPGLQDGNGAPGLQLPVPVSALTRCSGYDLFCSAHVSNYTCGDVVGMLWGCFVCRGDVVGMFWG